MSKITPCLWFNGEAEEAANFYVSLLADSKIEVVQKNMTDGRVSKPGRRVYVGSQAIKKVRNGIGVSILSTSKGIMTDQESRKNRLGGEVLCSVW